MRNFFIYKEKHLMMKGIENTASRSQSIQSPLILLNIFKNSLILISHIID